MGTETMTSLVLVDTDILIDAGRNIGTAIQYLDNAQEQYTLAVSAVTQMELIVGCRNKAEFRALDKFLERFRIITINEVITEHSIELLRKYRLSHGLLIADALIAATAMASNELFVTKNQLHYQFISGLNLLPYPG
jgi:predicted nucleic acid-binding protein